MGLIFHCVCAWVHLFVYPSHRDIRLSETFSREKWLHSSARFSLCHASERQQAGGFVCRGRERVGNQSRRRCFRAVVLSPGPFPLAPVLEPCAGRSWMRERKRDVGLWPARATRGRAARAPTGNALMVISGERLTFAGSTANRSAFVPLPSRNGPVHAKKGAVVA